MTAKQPQQVRFLFDPACPWAWRTSLWIREVKKVRPVDIDWGVLSLSYINRNSMDQAGRSRATSRQLALRLLQRAKAVAGNDGIDRLYLALGKAVHERKESLANTTTLQTALAEADLPADLLAADSNDDAIDTQIDNTAMAACADGAIGVPTLYLNGDNKPYFGPVIDRVPTGEEASQLWDHLAGLAQHPYFYELKRSRH